MNRLSNMLTSPPPVYWVDHNYIREHCPPPHAALPGTPQYPVILDSRGGVWQPSPPHFQPQILYNYTVLPTKMQPPVYLPSCPLPYNPPPKKTLNPNAQEWVPREYRNDTPPFPTNPHIPQHFPYFPTTPNFTCVERNNPQHPPQHPSQHDFCEITDEEVEAARMNLHYLSTNFSQQCQGTVPQCPPPPSFSPANCDLTTVTSERIIQPYSRTQENEGKIINLTAGNQMEIQPQSWKNCVTLNENDMCLIPVCSEGRKKSTSPELVMGSHRLCLNGETCKNNENLIIKNDVTVKKPVIKSDQVQQSSESPTDRLVSGLTLSNSSPKSPKSPVEAINSTSHTHRLSPDCIHPNLKSSTSPVEAANLPSDTHRLSPDCVHPIPMNPDKSASPKHDYLRVEKSATNNSATNNSASISYARVVGRASPSPLPPADPLKYPKVPKIFLKDQVSVGEVPCEVPTVPGDGMTRNLFRRPNKTQKTCSKTFLQELKDSREDGGRISPSPSTSTSDLSSSPSPSLPFSSPPSSPSIAPPKTILPPPCTPTPQTTPLPPESPRVRSCSESSGSSVDIEFVEQDEVDRAAASGVGGLSGLGGLDVRNAFLACILGAPDSDSDSEDDSESDWDEVSKDDTDSMLDLDQSWDTFGFGLVVVQCQTAPLAPSLVLPPQTDGPDMDPKLEAINQKWNEEVNQDVKGRTGLQVRFGGSVIHPMVAWGHAYRQARLGPWEQQARDRARFAQRIHSMDQMISEILDQNHRKAVYHRLCTSSPIPTCPPVSPSLTSPCAP